MKKRIALAAAVSAVGIVLGLPSPAMASNWATANYDANGNYIGCVSKTTGHFYTPAEITELGCNADFEMQ